MPTLVTHAAVGIGFGKILTHRKVKLQFWILTAICPLIPDLDAIGYKIGIPYGHFFGHRGFFHSIFFALIIAFFITKFFLWKEKFYSRQSIILTLYFYLLIASHGILDAFTDGGFGIALFAPFNNSRYFFPWAPIKVSPLGFKEFFSLWGLEVIVSEILWIWLPLISLVILTKIIIIIKKKRLINSEKINL